MVAGSQGMGKQKNSEFTATTITLRGHLQRAWSWLPSSTTGMFSPVCRRVTKILVHTSGQSVERVLLTDSREKNVMGKYWRSGEQRETPGILQTGAVICMFCTAIQLHGEMCTEMLVYFGKSWELFFFCMAYPKNVYFPVISNPIIISQPDNPDNFYPELFPLSPC